jgi:hypothetical protein
MKKYAWIWVIAIIVLVWFAYSIGQSSNSSTQSVNTAQPVVTTADQTQSSASVPASTQTAVQTQPSLTSSTNTSSTNAANALGCAQQSKAMFDTQYAPDTVSQNGLVSLTYTNHLNTILGKCFMVVTIVRSYQDNPANDIQSYSLTFTTLYDVYENKELAWDTIYEEANGQVTNTCTVIGNYNGNCTITNNLFNTDMESTTY